MREPSSSYRNAFSERLKLWSSKAIEQSQTNWEEQLRLLSEIGDSISPDATLQEIIANIYMSVNHLMDAFQFSVGLYNEQEKTIIFKGIIENHFPIPDFSVDATQVNRLAPWCIQHNSPIFINDMDKDYKKYVPSIPKQMVGFAPNAALYVPLSLENKVIGLITVRTPRKNVYQQHHLYILKTLGNFVVRSLLLSRSGVNTTINTGKVKNGWNWNELKNLSVKSKKLLSLLTEREKQVLFLMVSGLANKTIAQKLSVSAETIKTHTLHLYQKLDVPNRTTAIMKAIEHQWFI